MSTHDSPKNLKHVIVCLSILLLGAIAIVLIYWQSQQPMPLFFVALLGGVGLLFAYVIFMLRRIQQSIRREELTARQSRETLITYVRVLSHEVRNPINGILNSLDRLREQLSSPEQLREVAQLARAARSASDVVENIVTLNKGDVPVEAAEARRTNLPDTVESCFRIARFSNPDGVQLKYSIDPDVPSLVLADSLRLSQILLNLLGNAVKYTRDGEVELLVRNAESVGQHALIEFTVVDQGPGIAEHEIDGLFAAYQQGSSNPASRHSSTGLGLAYVKRFVDDLQGTIEVQSRLGVGSAFTVRVPLEIAEAQEREFAVAQRPERENRSQPHVLVAEDNEINQLVASRMLQKLGCQVSLAADGALAVELAKTTEFDMILMDLQMPGVDGLTATVQILESIDSAPHIVAMTANVLQDKRQHCIDAGMSDFLAKPIKLNKLHSCLRKHGVLP